MNNKLKDLKAEFTRTTGIEAKAKEARKYLKEKEIDLGKLDFRKKGTWLKVILEINKFVEINFKSNPKKRFTEITGRKATAKEAREFLYKEAWSIQCFELIEERGIFSYELRTEQGKAFEEEAYNWVDKLYPPANHRHWPNLNPKNPWNFSKPGTWQKLVDLLEKWVVAKTKLKEKHRIALELEKQAQAKASSKHWENVFNYVLNKEKVEHPEPLHSEVVATYGSATPSLEDVIRVHGIASQETFKQAKRQVWKKYHPDLHQDINSTITMSYFNDLFDQIESMVI